jgi:hypothetical protein
MKWLRDGALPDPKLSRSLAKCVRCGTVVNVFLKGWIIEERFDCHCPLGMSSVVTLQSRALAESSQKLAQVSKK